MPLRFPASRRFARCSLYPRLALRCSSAQWPMRLPTCQCGRRGRRDCRSEIASPLWLCGPASLSAQGASATERRNRLTAFDRPRVLFCHRLMVHLPISSFLLLSRLVCAKAPSLHRLSPASSLLWASPTSPSAGPELMVSLTPFLCTADTLHAAGTSQVPNIAVPSRCSP